MQIPNWPNNFCATYLLSNSKFVYELAEPANDLHISNIRCMRIICRTFKFGAVCREVGSSDELTYLRLICTYSAISVLTFLSTNSSIYQVCVKVLFETKMVESDSTWVGFADSLVLEDGMESIRISLFRYILYGNTIY